MVDNSKQDEKCFWDLEIQPKEILSKIINDLHLRDALNLSRSSKTCKSLINDCFKFKTVSINDASIQLSLISSYGDHILILRFIREEFVKYKNLSSYELIIPLTFSNSNFLKYCRNNIECSGDDRDDIVDDISSTSSLITSVGWMVCSGEQKYVNQLKMILDLIYDDILYQSPNNNTAKIKKSEYNQIIQNYLNNLIVNHKKQYLRVFYDSPIMKYLDMIPVIKRMKLRLYKR